MRDLPTGTLTLLFTDIAGSTCLLHQLGERYASMLLECRQVLRAVFEQWNGHEVDTQGDAFFVVFARATDAVSAAVAAQRALASHAFPEGVAVRMRVGLHTGEPQRTADGYVGLDVHRAARIMSAGHGGQVLLSQTISPLVKQDLPEDVHLRDLGEHRLKDPGRPMRLFQLVVSDLPADFPPLNTLESSPNNLPVQPTPFLGREHEVAAAVAAQGNHTWAAHLWGAAEALREAIGTLLPPVERVPYDRAVEALRTRLGEQAFAAAWAEGRTLSLEQALATPGQVALPVPTQGERSSSPTPASPQSYPDGLTAREVEVLCVVAQGLTNEQVAERLVISPRTVDTHLTSIYSKIGVSSRVVATRYAIEHHLV